MRMHRVPDGACDCDGNTLDALGVCGGTCALDTDTDSIRDVDDCVNFDTCDDSTDPETLRMRMYSDPRRRIDYDGNTLDALGVCGGSLCARYRHRLHLDDVDDCVEPSTHAASATDQETSTNADVQRSQTAHATATETPSTPSVSAVEPVPPIRTRTICDDVDDCVGAFDTRHLQRTGDIYECGCTAIPDGACDCDGNTLDALGVCGGTCALDTDTDSICDDVDDCVGATNTYGICNGPETSTNADVQRSQTAHATATETPSTPSVSAVEPVRSMQTPTPSR